MNRGFERKCEEHIDFETWILKGKFLKKSQALNRVFSKHTYKEHPNFGF